MRAAALHGASQWAGFCLREWVANMVSTEMDAGNEKPRAGAGAGSLIESGLFDYAPARPAPVGPVISTSASSEAAVEAGLGDRGAAVVWRCSMGRDKHATFAAVKPRLLDARMGVPQCSGKACRGSMVAVESDAAKVWRGRHGVPGCAVFAAGSDVIAAAVPCRD